MKKLAIALTTATVMAAPAQAQFEDFGQGNNWAVVYNDDAEQCIVSLSGDQGFLLLGRDNEGVHLFTFGLEDYQGESPEMGLQWGLPDMNMGINRQLTYHGFDNDRHIYSLKLSQKLIDYFWVADRVRMAKFGEEDVLDVRIAYEYYMHSGFYDCIRKHQ